MNHLILKAKLEKQKEATKNANKEFHDQSEKTIDELGKFYLYITSLSSGAIVISITFLGNLIDKIKIVQIFFFGPQINLLFLSWISLFISIFTGLIHTFSRTSYAYFARGSIMLDENLKLAEEELEYVRTVGLINPEDFSEEEQKKEIESTKESLIKMSKKENIQHHISQACGLINRISFIIGILFLITFGIISLYAIV